MADTSCVVCKKQGTDTTPLKRCAKCKTQWYCSRDCQKADWKNHKKTCAKSASETFAESPNTSGHPTNTANTAVLPKYLSAAVGKPFHRLKSRTWLHDLPAKDVYQLLIDVYRLRMEDQYVFEGECDLDSIYGGRASSKKCFRRFLCRAEKAHGVLPFWWDEGKAIECENAGMRGGWSSLASMVEKSDIVEHYDDLNMPMQLRMLGEQIYGRELGGHDGTEMMQLMKSTENGEMMLGSGLFGLFLT